MINTNPLTSLAGTAFIRIGAETVNANAEIDDLGDVTYEFDLVPSDATVRGIAGIAGACTVKLWDRLDDGNSLYESLEQSIGNYDGRSVVTVPTAPSTLYWLPRGESNIDNAWRFQFDLKFTDVMIDERSQKTTVKLSPKSVNINIDTWATGSATNNFPSNVIQYRLNGVNFESYFAGDFIYDIVSEFDTGIGNTTIYNSTVGVVNEVFGIYYVTFPREIDLYNYDGPATSLQPAMFVNGPDQEYANTNLAIDKVRVFSGIDGCIFGTGFNRNFYMSRKTNIYNVEIANSDLADLSFIASPRSINSIVLSISNTNVINSTLNIGNNFPGILAATSNVDGWAASDQQINVGFSSYFPHLSWGEWSNTQPLFSNGEAYLAQPLGNIGQVLELFSAAQQYAFSTGAWTTNASTFKIEADILGASKLRPYEVIKFDNTVPVRYQGKHFRPTSVTYDLQADRVKVTAYQIDSFTVAQDMNVNVNVGTCESGGYMINLFAYTESFNVNSDENGTYTQLNLTAYTESFNVNSDENSTYTVAEPVTFNTFGYSESATNSTNSLADFNVFLTA